MLKEVTLKIMDHPELFSNLEHRLQFDWANLYHCLGKCDEAYNIYMNLYNVLSKLGSEVDPFLTWMTRVNAYLIDLTRGKVN